MEEFALTKKEEMPQEEAKKKERKINFQEMPTNANDLLDNRKQQELIERFTNEAPVAVPLENNTGTSYLNLVLSPNFRELELMIRGLEYVKRFNPILGREEVILRKIENHPLNEYGINKILEFIKVWSSPEIKLGRKSERDYYNSVAQVSRDAKRLVYKNLKNFGMDTQVKQRSAKTYVLAIIEYADASFSRSLGGRENDLSRATELKIEGNINPTDLYANFSNKKKEELKN